VAKARPAKDSAQAKSRAPCPRVRVCAWARDKTITTGWAGVRKKLEGIVAFWSELTHAIQEGSHIHQNGGTAWVHSIKAAVAGSFIDSSRMGEWPSDYALARTTQHNSGQSVPSNSIAQRIYSKTDNLLEKENVQATSFSSSDPRQLRARLSTANGHRRVE